MIDLTKPIEAVHKDGRVVPVELDQWVSRHAESFFTAPNSEVDNSCHWKSDGSPVIPSNPWTIRNVAEEPLCDDEGCPNAEIPHVCVSRAEQLADPDDWAIEEALKQAGWTVTVEYVRRHPNTCRSVLALARMIQRYQPELEPKPPVDPDIAAVREILAAYLADDKQMVDWLHAGVWDNKRDFLAAVEAFRRVKGGVL